MDELRNQMVIERSKDGIAIYNYYSTGKIPAWQEGDEKIDKNLSKTHLKF